MRLLSVDTFQRKLSEKLMNKIKEEKKEKIFNEVIMINLSNDPSLGWTQCINNDS